MPEVVELRIHGVGGATAEALLGVESPADTVQVAAEGPSTFHARRSDRRVEGYVWGRLTSRALLQPLWLFLLPFTLMNVAAWMHLPNDQLRWGREDGHWPFKAFRLILFGLGLGLTLAYVFWIANLSINTVVAWKGFLGEGPIPRILLGWVLVILAILAFLVVARSTQQGFEGFRGPEALIRRASVWEAGPQPALRAQQLPVQMIKALVDPQTPARLIRYSTREERLTDPEFWARWPGAEIRLYVHVGVALVGALVLLFWSLARAHDPDGLRLSAFATYTTEVLLWGLLGLGAIHFLGWRGSLARTGFRWAGPLVAATLSVGLASGFFYGLTLWLLGDPGRVASLGTAFGVSMIGWALGLAWLAVWVLRRRRTELARAKREGEDGFVRPAEPPGRREGRELTGATPRMYRQIGLHRSLANASGQMDVALFLSQTTFLLVALIDLRTGALQRFMPLAAVGNWVALVGAVAVLTFLLHRSFRPGERRIIGIVWEVLTFWPRRFHPLAVRPYAERAVPELQNRLWHHVKEKGRRVIVSAHSQGTVIAYAALAQLTSLRPADSLTEQTALVTYGCPLRQLYAWAFPAYFDPDDFRALRSRLFDGADTRSPWAWRNLYRRTDFIGKEVFGERALERIVPDPAEEPQPGQLPLDRPIETSWPDTPRTAWMDLAKHSFYNHEEMVKTWLAQLRERLSRGPRRKAAGTKAPPTANAKRGSRVSRTRP
jgi:hypothetical protein